MFFILPLSVRISRKVCNAFYIYKEKACAGTEFKGGRGDMSPQLSDSGGHNIFCPPIFCDKK